MSLKLPNAKNNQNCTKRTMQSYRVVQRWCTDEDLFQSIYFIGQFFAHRQFPEPFTDMVKYGLPMARIRD